MYPRTSIDNFRRVRQLSHMVQGQIAQSYGKRIGKHMTSLVGPWTAGLFDNDKSVVRAANESFVKVFASEEKRKNVWRLYQSSIIEYHRDVVVEETAATLSDERTTSPDDASAKYARVVGSSILVVSSRLGSLASLRFQRALKANQTSRRGLRSRDCEDPGHLARLFQPGEGLEACILCGSICSSRAV